MILVLLMTLPMMACGQDAATSEAETAITENTPDLIAELGLNREEKAATEYTVQVNSAVYSLLDFSDTSEYENATHGLIDAPEVLELKDAEGNVVKPLDFSITKTSAAIMIAVVLLIVIIMVAKNGYKKRPNQAPKGLQSLVEYLVVFVRDDIVRPMIGEKHYRKYLPYLLTLFFFIFFCNVLGLIPIFPAGANISGSLAVTATLAVITFLITNISGNKHYWTDIFNTPGVPAWLKVFPLMPLVELVGVFTKPIVLMIRLFANMTAGHIVILGFIVIIYIMSQLFGTMVGGAVSVVSVFFCVFISLLECLVAYLQAFVFTMLSALYIGMAVEEPHHA